MFQTDFRNKKSMLFKEQKTLLSMQEICLKLSFLCYKLCFFAFVVKSMLVFDGFLLQYVFSVKQKKMQKQSPRHVEPDEFGFLLQDCLFTAQQTNVNHTPNTSLVNSSSCSLKAASHPHLNNIFRSPLK